MKRVCMFTLALLLSVCYTACVPLPSRVKPSPVEINPNVESFNLEKIPVTLYFQYGEEFLLAGETRIIEAPVNGRLENIVLKALIEGPTAQSQSLRPLIDPATNIVNISEEREYLFVTLSADFIKTAITDEAGSLKRRLAVYSIVNTLIELGGYARIQLRIDKDGSGIGQNITNREAGFEKNDNYLDPLGFYSPAVLNPKNTVREFLKSYAAKDWEKVYESIATRDVSGDLKPSEDDFLSKTVSFTYGVETYDVNDYYISSDGMTAVVITNFNIKTKDGQTVKEEDMPVKLIRDNGIWRVSYNSFEKVFSF